MDYFDTETFIAEIKSRPIIWDNNCEGYGSREAKKRCWEEVADLFGGKNLNADKKLHLAIALQKRWKGIRSSYIREIKRQMNLKAGLVPTERKSEYIYYKQLYFLEKTVNVKDSHADDDIASSGQIPQYQDGQDSNSSTEKGLQSFLTQPTTSAYTEMPFTESSLPPILPPSAAKAPLIRTPTNFGLLPNYPKKSRPLLDMGPLIELMQNKSESINNKQTNDFEDFSNYLANVLKSLPLNLALKAQREIHLLVINARLNFLISSDSSSKTPKMSNDRRRNAGINSENRIPGDDPEYSIFQTDTLNDVNEESEFDIFETPLPKVEPGDDGSVPIEFDPMSAIIKEEITDEKFENPTAASSMIMEEFRNSGVSFKKKRKLDETQTSDFSKLQMAKSFESKDEFYHFGKGISMQLIQLSKNEAKRCQMEIQKIIQEKMSMAGENFFTISRNT